MFDLFWTTCVQGSSAYIKENIIQRPVFYQNGQWIFWPSFWNSNVESDIGLIKKIIYEDRVFIYVGLKILEFPKN